MVYYNHFKIIIDPCNLISSSHCDVFLNRTIFCSVRVLLSFVHLTKYEMDSSKKASYYNSLAHLFPELYFTYLLR